MEKKEFINIAIIGLGEIGSRHLQALINCNFLVNIFCVDPSSQSIEVAKSRVKQSSKENVSSLNYYKSLEGMPGDIDLAVIATSSRNRLEVLKSLVNKCNVSNIIFEKVLFQKLSEFEEASAILNLKKINSWVNCSRRTWPIYKEVKNILKNKKGVMFKLTGGPWGMGCNSIHFIDIFEWLTSSRLSKIDIEGLDPEIILSKRAGYQEFRGILELRFNNENILFLESNSNEMPSVIEISAKGLNLKIDEVSGNLISGKGNKIKTQNFPTPFQSDLSNIIANDILMNNKSVLPSFPESYRQHVHMLSAFQRHIEKITGIKIDHCPIT